MDALTFLNDNFISNFFVAVIKFFYGITGDHLLAVILLTLTIKLLLLPLDLKQRKNMNKINSVQGKLAELKQRYKNDPQLLNTKMRELYKKENINTMSGCLPLLLQLPILFAMFGAITILSNTEMIGLVSDLSKGKDVMPPSALWVHNIWMPDTGSANVMPSAAEYSRILSTSQGKVSDELIEEGKVLLQDAEINRFSLAVKELKNTSYLGDFFINSYNTIPTDAIEKAAKMNYDIAIKPVLYKYEGLKNGYWLFPLLSGAMVYLSTKLMNKRNAAMQNTAGNSKMMEYFMPAMIIWFSTSVGVSFAVYYMAQNFFTLVQNLIYDFVQKRNKTLAEKG